MQGVTYQPPTIDLRNQRLELKIPAMAFFDVDGTLRGKHGEISKETAAALQKLMQAGCEVGLATGRPPFSVKALSTRLGLNGASVCLAGAALIDAKGETILSRPLSLPLTFNILSTLDQMKLPAEIYSPDDFYMMSDHPLREIHAQYLDREATILGSKEDIEALPQILKILTMERRDNCPAVVKRLEDQFPVRCAVGYGAGHPEIGFINIISKEAIPADLVSSYLSNRQTSSASILACGDAPSDESMLKLAGISIAMGDAPQSVKNVARYVTTGVEEEGVSFAIEKLFKF